MEKNLRYTAKTKHILLWIAALLVMLVAIAALIKWDEREYAKSAIEGSSSNGCKIVGKIDEAYNSSEAYSVGSLSALGGEVVWIEYDSPIVFKGTIEAINEILEREDVLRHTPLGLCLLFNAQWYDKDWSNERFVSVFFSENEDVDSLSGGDGDFSKTREWALEAPMPDIQIPGEFRVGKKGDVAFVACIRSNPPPKIGRIAGPFKVKMVNDRWYMSRIDPEFGMKYESLVEKVLSRDENK